MKYYKLIVKGSSESLNEAVTELLNEGWTLHGSPSLNSEHEGCARFFLQAVEKNVVPLGTWRVYNND